MPQSGVHRAEPIAPQQRFGERRPYIRAGVSEKPDTRRTRGANTYAAGGNSKQSTRQATVTIHARVNSAAPVAPKVAAGNNPVLSCIQASTLDSCTHFEAHLTGRIFLT
jgi:hypothetical protein